MIAGMLTDPVQRERGCRDASVIDVTGERIGYGKESKRALMARARCKALALITR